MLIMLGDEIFECDYQQFIQNPYTVIGVKRVSKPQTSGIVEVKNKFITRLIEKPKIPPTNLGIAGIYYIKNSKLLFQCLDEIIQNDIRTHNEYQLTDALQLMLAYGEPMKAQFIRSLHCGTPVQLLDANRAVLKNRDSQVYDFPNTVIIPPVFFGEDTVIERAIIGPYASIGGGARVVNAIIKDAIIHPNTEIQNVLIDRSVIGSDAQVHGLFHQFNIGSSAQIDLSHKID